MIGLSDILQISQSDWKTMLQHCVQNIRANFKEGKMQDGKSGLQYKSAQYKKYKANAMRRFTKDTKKGRKSAFKKESIAYKSGAFSDVFHREDRATGKRLSGSYAKSIESTQTAFVDMTLTGNLKKGLKVKSVNSQGGIIGYEPEDAKKLEGNRRYGREVVGLNEENQEKLKKEMVEILSRNAQTILAKDIKIQVTL